MKINNTHSNYVDYMNHQKIKTVDPKNRKIWMTDEWDMKIKWFTELFQQHSEIIKSCNSGLCVCARMGQEVVALQNLGMHCQGIDLVANEPYVIHGDMHNIPFPDSTFDFVFSNSFDHSLKPDIFVKEIERVLKPGGYCLLILQPQVAGDEYAENDIDSSKEVSSLFKESSIVIDLPLTLSFHWVYNWKLIMNKTIKKST
jgi:SAM-dependent methyltransferase